MNADELKILQAVLDRIIPSDEFPGATESGVGDYIQRQLVGDLRASADQFSAGLASLNAAAAANFGKPLPALSPDQQDDLLSRIERGEINEPHNPAVFFNWLINLAMEGFYSDPGNGGNRDCVSWKMTGYEPRQQFRGSR